MGAPLLRAQRDRETGPGPTVLDWQQLGREREQLDRTGTGRIRVWDREHLDREQLELDRQRRRQQDWEERERELERDRTDRKGSSFPSSEFGRFLSTPSSPLLAPLGGTMNANT